jgi:hypothetical protein
VSYRDEDQDTDIVPAEELESSDRRNLNQYSKKSLTHNYSHRVSGPLKSRDQNIEKDRETYHSKSIYSQASSQSKNQAYVPKHYQIPKKEKSTNMNTQWTLGTDISGSL